MIGIRARCRRWFRIGRRFRRFSRRLGILGRSGRGVGLGGGTGFFIAFFAVLSFFCPFGPCSSIRSVR